MEQAVSNHPFLELSEDPRTMSQNVGSGRRPEGKALSNLEFQRKYLREWLTSVTTYEKYAALVTGESLVKVCDRLDQLELDIDSLKRN